MITYDNTATVYDAACIRVGGRWYICGEARCNFNFDHNEVQFIYRTPTLKFKVTPKSGWRKISVGDGEIEIMGDRHSLKLEYI